MAFRLSERSLSRLQGVDSALVAVVQRAIELTSVDFSVIEGLRTPQRQRELYAQGRTTPGPVVTWTLKSKHIDGQAVDLLPVTGWGTAAAFESVASAMFAAADELGVKLRWGRDWNGNGVQERGETDSPHFELIGGH
jgi:peptidoglycan L-alanyl-D-glutamate endopeptidase CwlK